LVTQNALTQLGSKLKEGLDKVAVRLQHPSAAAFKLHIWRGFVDVVGGLVR